LASLFHIRAFSAYTCAVQIRLLPSTFDAVGRATPEQHLTTLVIDGRVALDAGSLALSGNAFHNIRDIIITHPHLDHIASLPIFIDDLFGELEQPVRVHTTPQIRDTLEANIFNWTVYPRFSELKNQYGPVMQYVLLPQGEPTRIAHLQVTAVPVNHSIPTFGMILDDGTTVTVFSSDTGVTEELWHTANAHRRVDAVILECSFPTALAQLADNSGHLTPDSLVGELSKLRQRDFAVFAMHLKPAYRNEIMPQLAALNLPRVTVMLPNQDYEV
jgi:ribonuclease BN (tRNA processing enzyme)